MGKTIDAGPKGEAQGTVGAQRQGAMKLLRSLKGSSSGKGPTGQMKRYDQRVQVGLCQERRREVRAASAVRSAIESGLDLQNNSAWLKGFN